MGLDRATTQDIEAAAALIRATDVEESRIHALGRMIAVAEMAAGKRAADRNALTSFAVFPERLAELPRLVRAPDPALARDARFRYMRLLQDMRESPGTGLGPLKIDFASLKPAARAWLAAPYLDLVVGDRFPYLCPDRSVPPGKLVYVSPGGPADADEFRSHLPALSAWLGAPHVIAEASATTITLVRRAPLPATLQMDRRYLVPGSLFLGLDTDTQRPVHIPLPTMPSGTLVVGRSGSGKSNATHVLLQSVLASLHLFQAVFLVDGKQGHTFRRYAALHNGKIRLLTEEVDVWRLMRQLAPVIEARNRTLAETGLETAPNNLIAVFIEEMSTYTAKPASDDKADAKAHAQFLTDLAALARRGRSAGLKMVITAQDPTDDQIPTRVRSNCQMLVAFRTPIDAHATMLMGTLTAENDPRALATGQARIRHDSGLFQTVHLPLAVTPGGRR